MSETLRTAAVGRIRRCWSGQGRGRGADSRRRRTEIGLQRRDADARRSVVIGRGAGRLCRRTQRMRCAEFGIIGLDDDVDRDSRTDAGLL